MQVERVYLSGTAAARKRKKGKGKNRKGRGSGIWTGPDLSTAQERYSIHVVT